MASYTTFFRKHTSIGSILVKMARLVILTLKGHTKIQNDSDIFDGVMTSFEYDVTSKTDDVITPPKMSVLYHFLCQAYILLNFLVKMNSEEETFSKGPPHP